MRARSTVRRRRCPSCGVWPAALAYLMGKTPPGPRAIVVDGSPVHTLVAELFSVFMAGPMHIDVFTSEAAARRWLRERSTPAGAELMERAQVS